MKNHGHEEIGAKFWQNCEKGINTKTISDRFDGAVDAYDSQERISDSKYVARDGEISFDLYSVRDELKVEISEMFKLNTSQKMAFEVICAHLDYSDLVYRPDNKIRHFTIQQRFKSILSGEGGTGKSTVIKAITEYARRIDRTKMVLRIGMFGSVASAMQGWTIAALLGQKYNGEEFDINKHKELIQECKLLIIDETSLIDKKTWILLNKTFQQAKGNQLFFGGIHLLFVGDCFQLPPSSRFKENSGMIHNVTVERGTEFHKIAHDYIKEITHSFILTEQKRMEQSQELMELGRGFRRGHFEKHHEEFLKSRFGTVDEIDLYKSIVLVGSRAEKAAWLRACQETKMKMHGLNCIGWFAQFSNLPEFRSPAEKVKYMQNLKDKCILDGDPLTPFSVFVKEELVTCKHNHSVRGGVTNGTFGNLKDLGFPDGTHFREFKVGEHTTTLASNPPLYALIETIDDGMNLPGFGSKIRPIWRHSGSIKGHGTITTLPMEPASVSTVHGIQGKTIPEEYFIVVTDLRGHWSSFPTAGYYVAFTRARNASQLIVLKEYTVRELNNLVTNSSSGQLTEQIQKSIEEYNRLWTYYRKTWQAINNSADGFPIRLDNPIRHRSFLTEPIGLVNLGNTCWLNSSLQLLSCIHDVVLNKTDSLSLRKDMLHQKCSELFKDMSSSHAARASERLLREVATHSGLDWRIPNDPLEFLKMNSDVFSLGGYLHRQRLACQQCHQFIENDVFSPVLNVATSQICLEEDVEEVIERQLNSNASAFCTNCGASATISNTFCFQEKIIININRVINGQKSENIVVPKEKITLTDMDNVKRKYRLRALIEHIGTSINTGHFICWISKHSGKFYLTDDISIGESVPFSSKDTLRTPVHSKPSILLYEKI